MHSFAARVRHPFTHAGLILLIVASTAFGPSTVHAQAVADLAVSQIDSSDPVRVGNFLTYRISVANNGPSAAANVRLTDVIPASSVFVSATPGCVLNAAPPVVTCQLGNLASGTTTWRSVTVRPSQVGPISNYARASSPLTFDPVLANNVSVVPTMVNP